MLDQETSNYGDIQKPEGNLEEYIRRICDDEISKVLANFRIIGPGIEGQNINWSVNVDTLAKEVANHMSGTIDCDNMKIIIS